MIKLVASNSMLWVINGERKLNIVTIEFFLKRQIEKDQIS